MNTKSKTTKKTRKASDELFSPEELAKFSAQTRKEAKERAKQNKIKEALHTYRAGDRLTIKRDPYPACREEDFVKSNGVCQGCLTCRAYEAVIARVEGDEIHLLVRGSDGGFYHTEGQVNEVSWLDEWAIRTHKKQLQAEDKAMLLVARRRADQFSIDWMPRKRAYRVRYKQLGKPWETALVQA